MQGDIKVESHKNVGTTFTFRIVTEIPDSDAVSEDAFQLLRVHQGWVASKEEVLIQLCLAVTCAFFAILTPRLTCVGI